MELNRPTATPPKGPAGRCSRLRLALRTLGERVMAGGYELQARGAHWGQRLRVRWRRQRARVRDIGDQPWLVVLVSLLLVALWMGFILRYVAEN